MELTNEFRVDRPVDETWNVLTDVERIAPALPGAQLQEIEGDEYRGIVKVKVGPITAQYKGKAMFVEKDDTNHKAVLKAEGRDTKGQGNASALITATLDADGAGTKVKVHTDLTVTGKVAQFGRGIMADVSTKLLNQFVEQLETTILAGNPPEPEAPKAEAAKPEAAVAMAAAEPEAPTSARGRADAHDPAPRPSRARAGEPRGPRGRAGRQATRAARRRRAADLPVRARLAPPTSQLRWTTSRSRTSQPSPSFSDELLSVRSRWWYATRVEDRS